MSDQARCDDDPLQEDGRDEHAVVEDLEVPEEKAAEVRAGKPPKFPDAVKQPAPGGPVPIPYPN